MIDRTYKTQRDGMVDNQLIPRGISDSRVLDAMRAIPRHLFVPEGMMDHAYYDMALSIGEGQTISQPYMVAKMTELLELTDRCKVLEIGTGSGYQTAVLAAIAREVFTIERIDSLSKSARDVLASIGFTNISFIVGDGSIGYIEAAPYDRIIITAAAPEPPKPLIDQLSDGGILIVPVGSRHSQQLLRIKRSGKDYDMDYSTGCVFVPLIGEYGWHQ